MKIGIVISQSQPEIVYNAFRFANFALQQKDEVSVFLLGQGVEIESIDDKNFNSKEQAEKFQGAGGKILACGTCLKIRNSEGSQLCPLSTMKDLYEIVKTSDRVLTF